MIRWLPLPKREMHDTKEEADEISMLTIREIRIDNCAEGCITDKRPNIRFALQSDTPGESLKSAQITSGAWSISTTDQVNNLYGGQMNPFTTYPVHIRAEGISGETAEGEASFTTGRMDTPWEGKWITDESYSYPEKLSPRPMVFRKSFAAGKEICKAWINATALGIYELDINGKKVGEDYFSPGFTSYAHQIQYQTYDIKDLLSSENCIKATVAGGWAAGSFTYHRLSHISCDRQAFLCEIFLTYTDGTFDRIVTDESWEVTEDSPFLMAEWYDGETFDACFDEKTAVWKKVDVTSPRGTPRLLAQYGDPVRIMGTMHPICVSKAPSGEIIYDFGQNFSGIVSIRLKNGKRGQTVVLRHAEVLHKGELFVKSLRTAKATLTFHCIDGEQTYTPRFTYMGFRYVGMTGADADDLELKAYVLHSDFDTIGSFECSNPLINRLNENIRWGGWSNFLDIPTDCPQRDERQGWTGDLAVFASTACFNFDLSRFLDKWLLDLSSEQGKNGSIPVVIPRQGDRMPPLVTACWGDSCILVPWAEYLARGNVELLRRQYPVMKRFLKAVKKWAGAFSLTPNSCLIWKLPFQYGDWCAPGETIQQWIGKGKWVATAYYANSCGILAQIAQLLGEEDDAAYFSKLKMKIAKAYREVFTDKKGNLKKEFQTGYVLPLHFGMTEDTETEKMAENLVRLLRENGNRLATGFPSTPYLLFALSDHGYLDAAYDVLLQEECPGWMYEVKAGGTTIWERWDGLRADGSINTGDLADGQEKDDGGMISFNHYANGAVGDWLYRRVAGIEPICGGYKEFKVAPMPGGGLTYARAEVRTPYGKVLSDWKIVDSVFDLTVEVPVSTTCHLTLPDGGQATLHSGCHHFSVSV